MIKPNSKILVIDDDLFIIQIFYAMIKKTNLKIVGKQTVKERNQRTNYKTNHNKINIFEFF